MQVDWLLHGRSAGSIRRLPYNRAHRQFLVSVVDPTVLLARTSRRQQVPLDCHEVAISLPVDYSSRRGHQGTSDRYPDQEEM